MDNSLMQLFGSDIIHINDLICFAKIGITKEERSFTQKVSLSFKIATDFKKSANSKDINDTVNYVTVANEVKSFVEERTWTLVEELSENVVSFVFEHFPTTTTIALTSFKFCVPDTSAVGVTIVRNRDAL
jgi:dihydroneopterin aldolase